MSRLPSFTDRAVAVLGDVAAPKHSLKGFLESSGETRAHFRISILKRALVVHGNCQKHRLDGLEQPSQLERVDVLQEVGIGCHDVTQPCTLDSRCDLFGHVDDVWKFEAYAHTINVVCCTKPDALPVESEAYANSSFLASFQH